MSDLQKNIVERLLKEQKKTKRDLAGVLKIKENSINRTLKSPNISIRKLEKIAEFFDVGIQELLFNKRDAGEQQIEYNGADLREKVNQITIDNLSEALNRSTKTIENLVKIIADNNLVGNSNP
ncbi:MAG: helix-turn-helix transcriptional regulator [Dysgonamonadaceae bacterium]|jgi:transcriptional regulator with XRE-family HTH domain|nr:helix-turn-helix transcriptional regulator [Dysgonamonadaceae bacterium]